MLGCRKRYSASFLPVRVSSKREFQVQLDAACPDFSSVINPVLIPITDKNSVITDINSGITAIKPLHNKEKIHLFIRPYAEFNCL